MMIDFNLCPQRVALQIGPLQLNKVVLANSPWARLRGWYGYRQAHLHQAGIDAVLLTATRSVHTLAMPFRVDLIWLDSHLCCTHIAFQVAPWRARWYRRASHVLECVNTGSQALQQDPACLLGQSLKWIKREATEAGKEA